MRWLKTLLVVLLGLCVVLAGILFTVNNTERVVVDLLFFQLPEASLSLWLIASFVVGGFLGAILSGLTIIALRTRLGSVRRRLNHTQQELDQLRVSALKDAV
ncbi:lipopolysaccharide assembly protein LapA domain-containing protein [Pontibacter sp. JAM-7]|uniref:lipopolysaccharide assembly protein LapA domain-containing protein n=1 Tax=Pontibacter sp. JAM-7 TaxID=3366581 RepID=UPI003AF459DA